MRRYRRVTRSLLATVHLYCFPMCTCPAATTQADASKMAQADEKVKLLMAQLAASEARAAQAEDRAAQAEEKVKPLMAQVKFLKVKVAEAEARAMTTEDKEAETETRATKAEARATDADARLPPTGSGISEVGRARQLLMSGHHVRVCVPPCLNNHFARCSLAHAIKWCRYPPVQVCTASARNALCSYHVCSYVWNDIIFRHDILFRLLLNWTHKSAVRLQMRKDSP